MIKRKQTKAIVVHHSASSANTTVEDINRWHKEKGWGGIGYHIVITKDGVVHTCRDLDEWGIQVANWNDKSVGVCLTGNFNKNIPTILQIKSLEKVLVNLCKKYNLKYWNIYGHRDIKRLFIFNTTQTACPGDNLYNLLPSLRRNVGISLGQIKK